MMYAHTAPSTALLSTTLVTSSLMMLTSTNWIMMWLALEINLMSMIPLMTMSKMSFETESSIKYFLIQATSSALMLTSMIMYLSSSFSTMSTLLFTTSLMIKMGMAPFHLWLPQVLNGLTWNLIIIITTWQKLGPLLILSYTTHLWNPITSTIMVSMSAILGSLGGINQTQMRPLIAYSSISHMAWMIACSSTSHNMTFLYFVLYSLITIMLIVPIKSMMKVSTSKFNTSMHPSTNMSSALMLVLLSLGGMPPLLGFIPKWMVISLLTETNIIIPAILITSSLISLYYYLAVFFASKLSSSQPLSLSPSTPLTIMLPLNTFPTLIILILL